MYSAAASEKEWNTAIVAAGVRFRSLVCNSPNSQRESGYDHEKMDSKARETQCVCVSREADVDRPLSGGASANTRP